MSVSTDQRDDLSPLHALAHALRDHGLTFPDSWEDFPWGETALKVRKKVFVFLHASEERVHFTVKLQASHEAAVDHPRFEPSGYGLGKHGWVSGKLLADDLSDLPLFKAWMEESFRLVAPKPLVRKLDARETS